MDSTDIKTLTTSIQRHWPHEPGVKAKRYVGQFFNRTRLGTKISAQVEGNHGTYTVSIQAEKEGVASACSYYIGKGGYCHHCDALAATFLDDAGNFREVKSRKLDNVQSLTVTGFQLWTYRDDVVVYQWIKSSLLHPDHFIVKGRKTNILGNTVI